MRNRVFAAMLAAVFTLPLSAAQPGGWAIVSVRDVPGHVVAGQPVQLEFSVLIHGITPLPETPAMTPGVELTSDDMRTRLPVERMADGRFKTTLTAPHPGEWNVLIESGLRGSQLALSPIPAITAGAAPPEPAHPVERGARVFTARGCVLCHVHEAVDRQVIVPVGPDLSRVSFAADYLRMFLADPSIRRTTQWVMPDLDLSDAEVEALIAFLDADAATMAATGAGTGGR